MKVLSFIINSSNKFNHFYLEYMFLKYNNIKNRDLLYYIPLCGVLWDPLFKVQTGPQKGELPE